MKDNITPKLTSNQQLACKTVTKVLGIKCAWADRRCNGIRYKWDFPTTLDIHKPNVQADIMAKIVHALDVAGINSIKSLKFHHPIRGAYLSRFYVSLWVMY